VDDSVDVVVARARLIDRALGRLCGPGRGMGFVLNLGAGYDMRPSFVDVLADVPVVEVDSAQVLSAKEAALATLGGTALGGTAGGRAVRRVAGDLGDPSTLARDALPRGSGVVLTEGVLQYLPMDLVGELASLLAAGGHGEYWLTDLVSTRTAGWMAGRLDAWGGGPRVDATVALLGALEKSGWTAERIDPLSIESRAMGSRSALARALPTTYGTGDTVALLRRR
jgi:O-methyltransferase involved in polyketide biosynthesis